MGSSLREGDSRCLSIAHAHVHERPLERGNGAVAAGCDTVSGGLWHQIEQLGIADVPGDDGAAVDELLALQPVHPQPGHVGAQVQLADLVAQRLRVLVAPAVDYCLDLLPRLEVVKR